MSLGMGVMALGSPQCFCRRPCVQVMQDLSSSKLAPMVALMAEKLRTPALPWMLPQSLTLSGFRSLPRDDYESEADLKT